MKIVQTVDSGFIKSYLKNVFIIK